MGTGYAGPAGFLQARDCVIHSHSVKKGTKP